MGVSHYSLVVFSCVAPEVVDLLEPYPRGDHMFEGQEIEPSLSRDEKAWAVGGSDTEPSDNEPLPEPAVVAAPAAATVSALDPLVTGDVVSLLPGATSHAAAHATAPLVDADLNVAVTNYEAMVALASRPGSCVQGCSVLLADETAHRPKFLARHGLDKG